MLSTISPARSAADLQAIRALFQEYAGTLEIDLCLHGFAAELAGLPGSYAPPRGDLFLAVDPAQGPLGCVALRPLDRPDSCEIKRLYVRPDGRRFGLGRALVMAAIEHACRQGYRETCLDTLPTMTGALALYRDLGFLPIAGYGSHPEGALCFARRLP